jgi:hypothetical protein
MERARPRRALKAPIGVRLVRVGGPAVAAGALITTVAVSAWPTSVLVAGSGVSPSVVTVTPSLAPSGGVAIGAESLRAGATGAGESDQAVRSSRSERADRSLTRPALTEADEKALVLELVQEKSAKERSAAEKKAEAAQKKAEAKAEAEELKDSIIGSRYTTADVKLRTKPAKNAKSVEIIDSAKKLKVTDTVKKGYRQVVVDGKARWVTNEYLSKKKPSPEEAAGISGAACGKSSGIESGLVSNGKKVYRAMCAAFPEVSSYGGRRGGDGGFHGTGQAVDAMISNSGAGWRLANWLRANASELGVSEVIYSQKIWTVQRSGEGWRGMSNRGSATANHYDHVHVSVY